MEVTIQAVHNAIPNLCQNSQCACFHTNYALT